jgi:two-component system cell cycle sensor histidine kinase/response regulator CckA
MFRAASISLPARARRFLSLLILAGISGSTLWAQATSETSSHVTGRPIIRSIQQFWDLSTEDKSLTQDFELECTVIFFDPIWRILFVQDQTGLNAYVLYGKNPHAFKAGETITARGQFIPPHGNITFEHATITPRPTDQKLPALPVTDRVTDYTQLKAKYVSLEGYVDRERRVDEHHLQLILAVNGSTVYSLVVMDPAMSTPGLTDSMVRIEGVYNPKVGPDGQLTQLEVLVPSIKHVTVLGALAEHPGFALPVRPINSLGGVPPDQLVRVMGTVVGREPERSVRIRDGTGQIDLMTGQTRPLSIEDIVEAIGYPRAIGTSWQLDRALFRPRTRLVAGGFPAEHQQDTIGLAVDVMRLSPEEANKGRPVSLTGVVTWSHASSPFFFIHDSTGGICIMRGQADSAVRSPGRNVAVQGVTAMGAFAPVVVATKFERVSDAILPVARPISIEHAMTGIEENQWVEMRGYLRRVYRRDGWNHLELATATSDFVATLPITEDVSSMVGSVVQLHGICTAIADAQRKLTGINLLVPGISYVQVDEPAPADLFSLPLRSLASLGQFETVQSFNRRLRVAGVVLHYSPGHSIQLEENGHSLLVLSRGTEPLLPGERIEAVGFLGRQAGRVALREAVYRSLGTGQEPEPRAYEPQDKPAVSLDGLLVTLPGGLIGSSRIGGLTQLTVQTPHTIFSAMLEPTPAEFNSPDLGSRIALTGVYSLEYDEQGRPQNFVLRLRSPTDIRVLESPSWWTRPRIMAFTGVLALGALLFSGWVAVLRRQVQQQTGQIRGQMEREVRLQADLARAGKLESLGLLAGGIAHDFNNLLTVLMGNISLIGLDGGLGEESTRSLGQAEKAANRARDLTQQLLTFAKGGAPIRSAVSLPEVVREVAEFALHGSKVRCRFDLPATLWPASVDKGQIGQVVQNIVINAMQAMPEGGNLEIAATNQLLGTEMARVLTPGRYVRLDIADQGPGITPVDLARIFDPYFTTKTHGSGLGLATVHSIIKKHAGHITAESAPGKGTTFHIWLPAAEKVAAREAASLFAPSQLPAIASQSRVLVMDDELFIRELACSILRRFGYPATAVPDGAAAVAEYARAQNAGEGYAVVILDLTIPGGMGGRQAMEELLKVDPHVRAIVSSGYSNDLVLSNYQAHGFRGMVSKPYDVTDFAHAVERVLRGERA